MKKKMLNFPAYLVLFSLSVLWLPLNCVMAEGDGAWTTTASPGYIFLIEEDLYNNVKHMSMTVLKPDYVGGETYWGPAPGSTGSTYVLKPLNDDFDMIATWQFNSVTQATVTVESCTTNCLWQPGQVVTLDKFFGDNMKADPKVASRVPKTGQTGCWDDGGDRISCTGTGQDGEYRLGVQPTVTPSSGSHGTYTVYGWAGIRFTDNRDGTVTDNLTGLTWLKNANCFEKEYWTDALSQCNNLEDGLCGLTDASFAGKWRLPNINELHSLVAPTRTNPALPIDSGYYFDGVQAHPYWSSTSYESYPRNAWFVSMFYGSVYGNGKTSGSGYYVWPVRSGN